MMSDIVGVSGKPRVGARGRHPPSVLAWPALSRMTWPVSSVKTSPPLGAYQWVPLEVIAWA